MSIKEGYIRVSQILAQWDRFSNVKPEVLEAKTILGSDVHEAIYAHENQIGVMLEDKPYGYFKSFLEWEKISGAKFIKNATRFYDDNMKITGEVDGIIKFPESEELLLIDFKTSATQDDLIWPLQGQFYYHLCLLNNIIISKRFLFIQLNKNGEMPKIREYKASGKLMNVCISAYNCYQYMNKLD